MNKLQDEEGEFLKKLGLADLQREYKQEKDGIISKIEREYETNSQLYENKSIGIKEDKFHKEVLNAAIFPFVQRGLLPQTLDYVYVRSSPLSERKLKNVDFLIVSPSKKIAIFGEAKQSVNDPSRIIDEMKQRIAVINTNLDYVEKYITPISKIEYVLVVRSFDANNMSKAIARSSANIILWHVGLQEQKLSIFVPSTSAERRASLMHYDDKLNRALSEVSTSTELRTFFPESHPVTKMELLTGIDKGRDDHFTLNEVKSFVKQELDNLSEQEIDIHTKEIIEQAIKINFVRQTEDGNYKIQSRFKKPSSRYEELKEKWIKYSLEIEKQEKVSSEIKLLKDKLMEKKRTIYKTLEDFPKED